MSGRIDVWNVMRETPQSWYNAWMFWFALQMNEPDRHDYYVMANTQAVCRSEAPLSKFKLLFGEQEISEEDEANMASIAKGMAMARVGGGVTIKHVKRSELVRD